MTKAHRKPRMMNGKKEQIIARIALRLSASYPKSDLGNPADPLDDLLYVILSGQTNEANYQRAFFRLKRAIPSWEDLVRAPKWKIRGHVATAGLARQKAGYIKAIITKILADFGEASLASLADKSDVEVEAYLTSLPGVGIKTARCVMMYTLGRDVFPLDVHCSRILAQIGLLKRGGERGNGRADGAQALVPIPLRRSIHVDLIQHGRAVCTANKPACDKCVLSDLCQTKGRRKVAKPTVVDLCSGVGGYSWGFMQTGFEILLGVDLGPSSFDACAMNIPRANNLKADATS